MGTEADTQRLRSRKNRSQLDRKGAMMMRLFLAIKAIPHKDIGRAKDVL